MVLGRDSAEVLPSGWFPLAVFLRVACLRSGGGGFGWLSLAGPYVLRDVIPGACLLLSSSPLALHGVVSPSPVCLSRAPAFRQVRVAMLAERFRGIALGPGAGFPFVSLPGGRVV